MNVTHRDQKVDVISVARDLLNYVCQGSSGPRHLRDLLERVGREYSIVVLKHGTSEESTSPRTYCLPCSFWS